MTGRILLTIVAILLTIQYGLNGATWTGWLLFTRRKGLLELDPVAAPNELPELVSVIVPMRNEEHNVDRCLAPLRSQSGPKLETIIVDDGSTDSTPERIAAWKAKWPELRVLRLDENENRPAGKSYAMLLGSQIALGQWLLFIDADVELGPDAASRIVATAAARQWPVLSVIGRPASSTFWEQALGCRERAWLPYVASTRPETVLPGAVLLIRRSLYLKFAGNANVLQALAEDTALAMALADYGIQPRTWFWPDAYRLRMYLTFRQAWNAVERIMIASGEYKLLQVKTHWARLALLELVPIFCILCLVLFSPLRDFTSVALLLSASFSTIAGFLAYGRSLNRLGISRLVVFTKPLGDLILCLGALSAALKSSRGVGATWRGRQYPKSLVQNVPRPDEPVSKTAGEPVSSSGLGLSLVVPLKNADNSAATERFVQMAAPYPDLELVIVAPAHGCDGETASGLQRRGFLKSRGHVVAFARLEGDYDPGWIGAIIGAFEDPHVQLVVGNTVYEGDDPVAQAASIRDWAQLKGLSRSVPRISAGNFAARREFLDRYEFGRGFDDSGALLVLATQAAMDGAVVSHVPAMVCRLKNPYIQRDTADQTLRSQYQSACELLTRGLAAMDYPPFGSRLLERFLPVIVADRLSALALKNFSRLCSEMGIEGRDRSRVFRALIHLAVRAHGVALRDAMRRTADPKYSEHTESQVDPEDGVRRAIYRVMIWYVREYHGEA